MLSYTLTLFLTFFIKQHTGYPHCYKNVNNFKKIMLISPKILGDIRIFSPHCLTFM